MGKETSPDRGVSQNNTVWLKYVSNLVVMGILIILVLIVYLLMVPGYGLSDLLGVISLFTSTFFTVIGLFVGRWTGSKGVFRAEESSRENRAIAIQKRKDAMEALLNADPQSGYYREITDLING